MKKVQMSNITVKIDDFLQVQNMDINNLNLLIGYNGTGKSVILKLNWLFGMFHNIIIISKLNNIVDQELTKSFNYLFENTFPETDWNGILEYQLTTDESCHFKLKDGKIESFVHFNYTSESEMLQCIYMSKDTRTFNSLDAMLAFRKMLVVQAKEEGLFKLNGLISQEMSKTYKYHDVQLLEIYLYKCNSYTYTKEEIESFSTNYNIHNIHRLYIDEDKCKFVVEFVEKKDDGSTNIKIKSASLLSAGEQSIINMFTVTSIVNNKN